MQWQRSHRLVVSAQRWSYIFLQHFGYTFAACFLKVHLFVIIAPFFLILVASRAFAEQQDLWARASSSHEAFMTQFEPMVGHLQNELAITKKSLQDRLEASSSSASMKRPAARAMTLEDMVDDQDAETEPPSNPEEPDDVPTPPWRQTPNPSPKVMANPPINIVPQVTVVTPALAPASELPRGYSWVDWNEPEALLQEAKLAEEHKIPFKLRGPCSPMDGGPDLWRDTKTSFDKRRYTKTSFDKRR